MPEAKLIQVADLDETAWLTIPGDTGDFEESKDADEDTIFGQAWTSNQPTLASWTVGSNARYRGFAGYKSALRRTGTPTSFTGVAMSEEEPYSNTYVVDDQTNTPWDWTSDIVIEDDGTEVAAENIVEIDPLFGRVVFTEAYTVSGPITASGDRFPMETFGRANQFDLSQSADTTPTTSFEDAQDNGGYMTMRPTLRTAELSLTSFYREENDFSTPLRDEEQFIMEIDPAGNGESLARGIFRISNESNTGDVGGDEETSVDFVLSVPDGFRPFSWLHEPNSTIPEALKLIIDSWAAGENIKVRYLPLGADKEGRKGEVVITDLSMSSDVEGLVEFDLSFEGTGAVEDVNITT